MISPESKEVRKGAARQKQEEFLVLLDPVYTQLERFCFAIERDRERAYDLIGETVLRAYEHFESIDDRQSFLSWLFTTASRLQGRLRWRRRLFGRYDERGAEQLHADEASPDESADVGALYAALALLPKKQREALVLFEINDMTLKEILAVQGGSLSALKVRLHRGRKQLAKLLGVEEEEGKRTDTNHRGNDSILIVP